MTFYPQLDKSAGTALFGGRTGQNAAIVRENDVDGHETGPRGSTPMVHLRPNLHVAPTSPKPMMQTCNTDAHLVSLSESQVAPQRPCRYSSVCQSEWYIFASRASDRLRSGDQRKVLSSAKIGRLFDVDELDRAFRVDDQSPRNQTALQECFP